VPPDGVSSADHTAFRATLATLDRTGHAGHHGQRSPMGRHSV